VSEEAILREFFKKWIRLAKLTLGVSLVALALGVLSLASVIGLISWPTAPVMEGANIGITEVKVVDYNGTPAFEVLISSNVWPIEVKLLYMNETLMGKPNPLRGRVLDSMLVKEPEEMPVHLFPHMNWFLFWIGIFGTFGGISGFNVYPGVYTVMAVHEDISITMDYTVEGADLIIENADFEISYDSFWGWFIDNVTLTIHNKGDCPAYLKAISVNVNEKAGIYRTQRYETKVIPRGETLTITFHGEGLERVNIKSPGEYTVIITINFGFKFWTYETTITVG